MHADLQYRVVSASGKCAVMDFTRKWTGPDLTRRQSGSVRPRRSRVRQNVALEINELLKPLALRVDALEKSMDRRITVLENSPDHHQLIASITQGAAPVLDARIAERVGELRSLITRLESDTSGPI
jgi:hypothetical protein